MNLENNKLNPKQDRRTSNIFLMSFQNDNEIQKFFSEERNDSSDEESNEAENKEMTRFSLKNKTIDPNEFIINEKKEESSSNKNNNTDNSDVQINNDLESIAEVEGKDVTKRSFLNRLVGPIDAGSIRGSIFSLSIFSLGSGCLALPQKIQQMSIIVAIVDIILSGLATYWTLNLMVIASRKLKNCFNYSKVVELLYGKKMSNFLVFTILIYTFGIMILYQVVGILIYI